MFINLTPHKINEVTTGTEIMPSGEVARMSTKFKSAGDIDGIPLFSVVYGDIEGLPEPQEGVTYIVSGIVHSVIQDRPDVVAPGELVRDENGKPIGCNGFKA
jgi:hypothetical protein